MALEVQRRSQEDVASHARRAIEGEIAMHSNAIIELKGRLNAMAPISKLPTEMLSEIFVQVAADWYASRTRSLASGSAYRWITVSHVCRIWRSVALNTPRMWSRIVLTRADIATEFLARSKSASLWVTAGFPRHDNGRAQSLDLIMQESERLKELHVVGPVRLIQTLSSRWTGPATQLEDLALSDCGAYDHSTPIQSLFSGQTPKLRRLDIHKVVVKWDNPLFCTTLTRLSFASHLVNTYKLGAFNQMLNALENMCSLKSLHLQETVPHLPDDDTTSLPAVSRTVALPRLRSINIHSDVIDCANLLNHLSIPPDTRISITARSERGVQELIRVLGERLASSKPLLSVALEPILASQVCIRGWHNTADRLARMDSDLEIYLDAFPHSRSMQRAIRDARFLSRARRLEIAPSFWSWDWQLLFGRMPDLRELTVIGHPDDAFFDALSIEVETESAAKSPPGASTLCMPKLTTLQLSNFRFGCPHSNHQSEYLESLLVWLQLRCHYGLPIDRLELVLCANADEDGVKRLREVVPDVEWDGLVISDGEEFDNEDDEGIYDEDWWPMIPVPLPADELLEDFLDW